MIKTQNGEWTAACKVSSDKRAPAPKFVVQFASEFSAGKPSGRPLDTLPVAVLEDENSTQVQKIIFGFFGGVFVSSDGMRASPTGVSQHAVGSEVAFHLVDAAGVPIGGEAAMPMEQFLADFPLAVAGGAGFDLSPYPKLLNVLRDAEVLPADASQLEESVAFAALAKISGDAVADAASAAKAAEHEEAMAAAPDASPERKRLRRAVQLGTLRNESVAAKAQAAIEM